MNIKHRISLIIRETLDSIGVEVPWYETDKVAEALLDSPDLFIGEKEAGKRVEP